MKRAAVLAAVLTATLPYNALAAASEGLPLETPRTISFETDEGTWMSLDVSPDGETVIFELLGDLYTLPAGGGKARRLTSGNPFDSQPAYSPDGQWIAFVSDRSGAENLWISRSDGTEARQISNEYWTFLASPAWSADSDAVVISRGKVLAGALWYELWSYPVDGGQPHRITPEADDGGQFQALGPVVSETDGSIYFARGTGRIIRANNVTGSFPKWDIVRLKRDGQTEAVVTGLPGNAIRPQISPDGKLLAYGTREGNKTKLRLRDLRTGQDRELTRISRDEQDGYPTRDLLPGYSFSPDGDAILIAFDTKLHRIDLTDDHVADLPFSAQVEQNLGALSNPAVRVGTEQSVTSRFVLEPKLSPDGAQIAYSAMNRLYVADARTGVSRSLLAGDVQGFQPTWSPDGKWIAFVTWSARGGHLWRVPADNSAPPQRITDHAAFYANPLWSADGSAIFLLSCDTEERLNQRDWGRPLKGLALVSVSAQGGAVRTLADAGQGQRTPSEPDAWLQLGPLHFGPMRDRIYAHAAGGLVSFRLDGSDRRTELEVVGRRSRNMEELPGTSVDLRISPDGRHLLASIARWLYLIELPSGELPAQIDIDDTNLKVSRLTPVGADSFDWAEDGRTITWSLGSRFFRAPLASAYASVEDFAQLPVGTRETDLAVARPRSAPDGAIVLRNARAITMRGDEVIERADILIKGDRIADVGPSGSIPLPAGAQVFDLAGRTIMPGIVDVHDHVGPAQRQIIDFDNNWALLANLAYGVTSLRDPSTHGGDAVGISDLVETGDILGPRYFSTATAIKSTHDFRSAEETKATLRRNSDYYQTHTVKAYLVGNRRQQQWMAQATYDLGLFPTSEGGADVKGMLTTVLDGFGGLEHNFPIAPLGRDIVELIARSGVAWTPVLSINYGAPWAAEFFREGVEAPQSANDGESAKLQRFLPPVFLNARSTPRREPEADSYMFPSFAEDAEKVRAAGGLIGVGGHGELPGLGTHWELWAMNAEGKGLPTREVLRAATLGGAQAIGVARDLGSIEPGKLADMIVMNRNPLDDIRATADLNIIVKNGEVFDADTLDRLWPDPGKLPLRWWQSAGGVTGPP